jgi:hypothetical protein
LCNSSLGNHVSRGVLDDVLLILERYKEDDDVLNAAFLLLCRMLPWPQEFSIAVIFPSLLPRVSSSPSLAMMLIRLFMDAMTNSCLIAAICATADFFLFIRYCFDYNGTPNGRQVVLACSHLVLHPNFPSASLPQSDIDELLVALQHSKENAAAGMLDLLTSVEDKIRSSVNPL